MKTKLELYIKDVRGITIKQAAEEVGVTRAYLHFAMQGKPVGRHTAKRLEDWSEGFLSGAELAGLK